MDILTVIQLSLDAVGSLVPDPKSFKNVIETQEDVLDELKKEITLTDEEKERIRMTYRKKNQEVSGDKNLVNLWHRAQRIRIYLSYYVNKLGGAPEPGKLHGIGSTREFIKDPKEELQHLLISNNEDLKILKRAIPILKLGKVKIGGKRKKTRINVPQRYVPKKLSKKDKKQQKKELKKSRKAYKKGKYHTRKKVKSFKSKVSPHILKARKMYKIEKIRPSKELAKASKCSLKGLKRMFQKGQGAYFSSGSRPNQTGHSWGYARMASAITGGKASAVDFHIIKDECHKNSRAFKLAKKARKTYKKGMKRVKQVKIGGKWSKKYKKSINCKKPKGFSQKQYCKYGRKKKKKTKRKKNKSKI